MKILYKHEDAKKKVVVDWTKWLGSAEIASVAWTSDDGITISDESNTTMTATAYVSSGTKDSEYKIHCSVTTDDTVARTEIRTFQMNIVEQFT